MRLGKLLKQPIILSLVCAALSQTGCKNNPPQSHSVARSAVIVSDHEVTLPHSLSTGTAGKDEVQAWASETLENGPVEFSECAITPAGALVTFACNPSLGGTGGNTYLLFQKMPSGFRYLGSLGFAAITPLPPDPQGRPRVETYWHMSADEGIDAIFVLTDNGFEKVSSKDVVTDAETR